MRYVLSVLLWPALLPAALAQDKQAETVYRDMEKKILAAKSFEVTFDYQIEGTERKKRTTKGTLLLTKDNKANLKVSGFFGEKREAPVLLVSDGMQLKTKGAKFGVASNGVPGAEPGGANEQKTPKRLHTDLGTLVSRGGVWYSLFIMPYLLSEGLDPDAEGSKVQAYDFKLGAAEKVGDREARVLRYRFGKGDKCPDDQEMTLWIDSATLLPLKRVLDLRENRGVVSGILITERYAFTLEPKIGAKAFELPK